MAVSPRSIEPSRRCTVKILGAMIVQLGEETLDIERWPAKGGELLRLLVVVRNHRMARDEVIELLWPDVPMPAGTSSLKTLVYRLRRQLEPAGLVSLIVLDRGWAMLNPQCEWEIDADQLLDAAQEMEADAVQLERAVRLWRGEPLIEDRYDDWAFPVREQLQRTWCELCLRLVRHLRSGRELERAIGWALRLLEVDPLDEEALRELLGVLLAAGRRVEARRRLEQYEARVWQELGVRAATETHALLDVPDNLPIQATPFIGREPELRALTDLLSRDEVRLLTLTGVGGVGKTRLALRTGARVSERYVHGVFFVSLASLVDPRFVAPAIAAALDVHPKGNQPVDEAIAETIGERQMLLVLDNCEHVLEGTLVIATLLSSCSGLNVLATSRERLHLAAEYRFDVFPLALPGANVSAEEMIAFDAVRLFTARATVAAPDFDVLREQLTVVVQLCRALDGLPLALELAAARSGELTPQAMLQHLADPEMRPRLSLLARGFRDLPARQQTLFATIEWSYRLLNPEEQHLFRQLSIFAGGCTLEAAKAVCLADNEDSGNLLRILTSLAEKSLVRQEDDGEPRYFLLETIREYASEQLRATDDTDEVGERHAAYFLARSENMKPAGAQSEIWLDRMEADLDNLRASLKWSQELNRSDTFLRLATGLFLFWERRNHLHEGIAWLDSAHAQNCDVTPSLCARALRVHGVLITRLGVDFVRSRALLEESLALYQALGTDDEAIAGTMQNLGLTFMDAGDLQQARPLLEESLARYRVLRDGAGVAKLLNNLGRLEFEVGDNEQAQRLLREGLALARAAGDKWMIGLNSLALGAVLHQEGNYVSARPLFRNGLVVLQQMGDKWAIALALRALASLALRQGEPLRAVRLLSTSEHLLATINMNLGTAFDSDPSEARSLVSKGEWQVAWDEGRAMTPEEAVRYALEA